MLQGQRQQGKRHRERRINGCVCELSALQLLMLMLAWVSHTMSYYEPYYQFLQHKVAAVGSGSGRHTGGKAVKDALQLPIQAVTPVVSCEALFGCASPCFMSFSMYTPACVAICLTVPWVCGTQAATTMPAQCQCRGFSTQQ